MRRHIFARGAQGLRLVPGPGGVLGLAVFGLSIVACGSVAHGADDPPSDAAAKVAADAKAVGTTVKHDAKVVAEAAKEGAQQVAEAAKEVAHDVAAATKQGAQEVAAAAKQSAERTKAAVKPDTADKSGKPNKSRRSDKSEP